MAWTDYHKSLIGGAVALGTLSLGSCGLSALNSYSVGKVSDEVSKVTEDLKSAVTTMDSIDSRLDAGFTKLGDDLQALRTPPAPATVAPVDTNIAGIALAAPPRAVTLDTTEPTYTIRRHIPFYSVDAAGRPIGDPLVYTLGTDDDDTDDTIQIGQKLHGTFTLGHANGRIPDLSGNSLLRFFQAVDTDNDRTLTAEEVDAIPQEWVEPRRPLFNEPRARSTDASWRPYTGRNSGHR